MQNKMVRFILNLRRRDSVKNKELRKVDVLNVPDRVKQLKMNHVFKIKKSGSWLLILTVHGLFSIYPYLHPFSHVLQPKIKNPRSRI